MIKTESLTFEYAAYDETEKPQQVLKGIDIAIQEGDFVAILGHNGSGKSTLARHLNALLIPTEGTLWINGKDTKDPANIWPIRQSTGMLFQNPDNQIVATVVEEDVAFGPENLGVPPAEIRKRVDEALFAVGMSEYASASPHHLSGGQKQRIAIAGVLAMKPTCIVLDEPTAMLDPSGRQEVLETITRLNREEGITVILITHFMEEAAHARRILVMSDGKVEMDGTPYEIFAQVKKMQGLGLDVPHVTALAHRLNFDRTILTVEEFMQNPGINDLVVEGHLIGDAPLQNGPSIIEIENLTHTYSPGTIHEKIAIDKINLSINKGEMVSIIGHTGSGKSTLIQHLNALLKPTSGQIRINGKDIHADKSKLKIMRQQVGLVFQYPEHQLFEATIYKDVAFGPTRMGLSTDEIDARVREAINVVGINETLFEKSPFELSGGQKRRVAIAGVLAMRPDVLILDEPTAGLDPGGKDEILAQIKHMHNKLGITVILVSHSMDDAARLSDRIFVLSKSKLVCEGSPRQVFAQGEMLRSIGLNVPQISQLFSELNKKNASIPIGVFTVEEALSILK